jgi:hypothetical protein
MSVRLNITVMLGGFSAEREVSLKSGVAVAKALLSLGHQVRELDPRNEAWILPLPTDVVFLALHGPYGEDSGRSSNGWRNSACLTPAAVLKPAGLRSTKF